MSYVDKKWASISMNEKFICIETYSGYRSSARDPNGVRDFHGLEVDSAMLGKSLRECLAESRCISIDEIPAFFDLDRLKRDNLAWIDDASSRTGQGRKALFKNMMNCSVYSRDKVITIKPSFHEKLEAWSGDGIDQSDFVILDDSANDLLLGEGVRLALSRCK